MSVSAMHTKIFLQTYGCQMNVLDSELVMHDLTALGYTFVASQEAAGIVLLNTCSIRQLAEQKVWSHLGRLGIIKETQKELLIGVLGCMAERQGERILQRMPFVDVICGPSELSKVPELIHQAVVQHKQQRALTGHATRPKKSVATSPSIDSLEALDTARMAHAAPLKTQAFVRITRGCNKFCSFCVVPMVRGPEVHRPFSAIINECKALVQRGVLEITLLGQTINHYVSAEGGKTYVFADLLHAIHERIPDLMRLRFLTSYPRDFTDDALDVMAASKRIAKFLHIPAQSGSNTILRRMNRGYTREVYLELIARAKAKMPNLRVAGDMIAGFCGETDEDHALSLSLLQKARYKSCFMFKYSARSGTVSGRRLADDVPEHIKRQRNLDMLRVQGEISLLEHRRIVGQTVQVMVERTNALQHTPDIRGADKDATLVQLGAKKTRHHEALQTSDQTVRLMGRTEGDELVAFDGPTRLLGQFVDIHIQDATRLTLRGQLKKPQLDHDILLDVG